jgi:hypothetical protein
MPAVSPKKAEAKNGLALDQLTQICSITPVPLSLFRKHDSAV